LDKVKLFVEWAQIAGLDQKVKIFVEWARAEPMESGGDGGKGRWRGEASSTATSLAAPRREGTNREMCR
jgi:hypothetical protein